MPEQKKKVSKITNELGRIQNADESPFRFVPHSVLRKEQGEVEYDRKMTEKLVDALTKGPNGGGIGPFEIMLVSWVQQLRYVTKMMVLDLIRGGYISKGWRDKVSKDKVKMVIDRLHRYNLVDISRFVSVDENGVRLDDRQSNERILTLGKLGNVMLHELGNNTSRYRPFDVFQDGNTVKRYLAANQWLVYWLVHFSEAIGNHYRTTEVIYQRGRELKGARFYATVTCNDCTMVAEPLRRVEDFEEESERTWMLEKLNRFLEMFSHLDELYCGDEKRSFKNRPVLVYVCEDEEHIQSVVDILAEVAEKYPEQEIWYTSDQRMFNYDRIGQRFLKRKDGEMYLVDIKEYIGREEVPRKFSSK